MADVCSSQVTCREQDQKEFTWMGYRLRQRLGNGCVQLIDDQADHGHNQELQKIAGQGVAFHGHSGAGNDYPPVVFASDGTEYATCDTIICDGLPAREVQEDGTVRGRESAEKYWRVLKSARARLSA
jgi:hypothetical protein